MSSNQLPENMGKKIVEALRKQAQMNNDYANITEEVSLTEENIVSEAVETQSFSAVQEIQEERLQTGFNQAQPNQAMQPQTQYFQQAAPQIQPQQLFQQPQVQEINETPLQFSIPNMPAQSISSSTPYNALSQELPTNVAVLKKLISQLPAGVSKQIGAQIIRQTIEALGISMNSVLQEAQQVQDGLNSAVTDCTLKMQEYKNQILQLEASTRDYQRQMGQINDLISLFILTDNK